MMATPIASSISISFFSCVSLFLLLCSSKNGYALGGGERKTLQSKFHSVQVNSLLPASVCTSSTKDKRKGASLKVVHKYGPCSHLHEHNTENAPTVTEVLRRDQSRVNSIQSRLRQNRVKESKATTIPANSGKSLGTGNYIVRIGLGTPKKDFTLVFDTGSDFTWTQCQPCLGSCYQQQEPIYDPSLSSTYINITCSSQQCSQLSSATGFPPRCFTNTCVYGIPQISFLFGGNIELPLNKKGILYAINVSQVCLAFAGNMAASDLAIFGNVQQQTLDVVYDVAGGKLGFGSGGCS
ncbi:hypothetical protein CsSME_00048845 [Camellia sinensis var. sinensis]